MTTDNDTADRQAERLTRNVMGEHNPDTWDPCTPDDDRGRPEVNVWDPIAGHDVNVPGHRYDRAADMDFDNARRLALRGEFDGLADDQPLPLLGSNMRTDPVEGTQGAYRRVVELSDPCPECGSDYAVHKCMSTLGGVHAEYCLLCEHEITAP